MMSMITEENFYREVLLACQAKPKKADGLGVIVSDPNSDLAKVWIGYAEAKGWPHRAKMWAQMLKQGCKLTMPCANPRDFDPGFMPVRKAYVEPERTSMTAEERRAVIDRAKARIASGARTPNDKRKDWEPPRPQTKAEAQAALNEALANPKPAPPLSDEVRAKLGIRPREQDAVE